MMLGSFLLLEKHSWSKFQESDSEATRRGEGLQRDTELLGEGKKEEKERRIEKGVSDKDKYNFKESGIGDSWLIGDDTGSSANAYVNYMDGCEENLEIPHTHSQMKIKTQRRLK